MRRHWQRFLPYVVLLLLGSLTLVHLMALPAFQDEGSQLRWAWRLIEARDWWPPLREGKPLEGWLVAPLLLAGFSPLVAARSLHVLLGMLGSVLVYRLVLQISDRTSAFVSALLFAICPFVVYLQRLALSEMFLCSAGIWVLLCTLRLLSSPTRRRSCAMACALVLAAVAKLPVGFLFLLCVPVALLLMPSTERRSLLQARHLSALLLAHVPALALASAVTAASIVQLRSGHTPGFGVTTIIGVGLGQYRGIADIIGLPRSTLLTELAAQLSLPVVLVGLAGIASASFAEWRYRWLVVMGLVPMLAIGCFTEFWYPRYLLFTLPPLIVAAVAGWRFVCLRAGALRQPVQWGLLALCTAFMGRQSALIVWNPIAASWSPLDRFQYIEGGGSGYGYPEAARYIVEARDAPAFIFSLDGHSAFQLLSYLPAGWTHRVKTISDGDDGSALPTEEARFGNLLEHQPVWIVVPQDILATYLDHIFGHARLAQINLRPLARFEKPGGRAELALYEVTLR